ncbi:hypothetical protein [Rhizobium sp. C1]|uniref:hypothetical protein n=1 Tax=Rhizobium sp. C1 TaxID=1349799 RepID=UPI001E35FFE5|nr:hypothetical protein [Rhizobium sp. C1]MCD2176384.1 hypothetical protein [Rhizobium sp. C1]
METGLMGIQRSETASGTASGDTAKDAVVARSAAMPKTTVKKRMATGRIERGSSSLVISVDDMGTPFHAVLVADSRLEREEG